MQNISENIIMWCRGAKGALKAVVLCMAFFVAGLFTGCIENDIPYPVLKGSITKIQALGQVSAPVINESERSVELFLADSVDLKRVTILNFEVSNDAVVTPAVTQTVDLTQPLVYTLTTYQDYVWTITANQTIDRYIKVENQVGQAVFDTSSKIVIVYVSSDSDLSNIRILDMKLGPQGSTIIPDYKGMTDFTTSQQFGWFYKERFETWSVRLLKSSVSVTTGNVNPFAKYAMVSGEFNTSLGSPSFMYKKSGDEQWQNFTNVDVDGGSFSAKLTGLEPNTQYVVKAVAGEVSGAEKSFTTESAMQISNSGFENWCKEGKSWFPNADLTASNYVWDSGNIGANTMGEKNPTTPEESIVVKGKAAKLASTAIVGVFAAGNIYTGKYVKTNGIGAQLDFGIPFNSRPTSLKGYYNYTPGAIDKTRSQYEHLKGKNDCCNIYIVLADWDRPFEINTTSGKFLDIQNDKNIIAYGELLDDVGTGGQYKEFEIKFNYKDLNRTPKYILVVAAASRYGDYFTGSTSSVLYVDEFALSYE
ncbi:MAG: PCMD domain-containing protein [Bacteroidales bacterium]|nr:PCMD domain-containing protein [Bacteroidales bacterium]